MEKRATLKFRILELLVVWNQTLGAWGAREIGAKSRVTIHCVWNSHSRLNGTGQAGEYPEGINSSQVDRQPPCFHDCSQKHQVPRDQGPFRVWPPAPSASQSPELSSDPDVVVHPPGLFPLLIPVHPVNFRNPLGDASSRLRQPEPLKHTSAHEPAPRRSPHTSVCTSTAPSAQA